MKLTPLKFLLAFVAATWCCSFILFALLASGCSSTSQKISPNEQWLQRYQNQHPKQAKEEVIDSFIAYLSEKKD